MKRTAKGSGFRFGGGRGAANFHHTLTRAVISLKRDIGKRVGSGSESVP